MTSPKQRWSAGRAALTRRVVRLPSDGPGLFDPVSYGRGGPEMPGRFSVAEIAQITRTVSRTPEVMVKEKTRVLAGFVEVSGCFRKSSDQVKWWSRGESNPRP
jgi:hypothetical protein